MNICEKACWRVIGGYEEAESCRMPTNGERVGARDKKSSRVPALGSDGGYIERKAS